MTTEERYRAILRNHLPTATTDNPDAVVDWVYGYLERYRVHFHVTRQRRSKLGDYRWPQTRHPYHEISVNGDLNPYLFLMVLLHEAAHLETHVKHGERVAPHGHEWQAEYAALLNAHLAWFPTEAREALAAYASRIPMPRAAGQRAEQLLHRYDKGFDPTAPRPVRLDDVAPDTLFRLVSNPRILFRAVERRRTRWLCIDTATRRSYTVSGRAEVKVET